MGGALSGGLNALLWPQNLELNWERRQGSVWRKLTGVNLAHPVFRRTRRRVSDWSTTGQWGSVPTFEQSTSLRS